MSLDVLANHIASQGRGRDSALIHMSPNEIASLRALAQAHGGDLTINPETGLPEAGFLEDILPAVAGFALDTFVPGLGEMTGLGSFAAPAIVGGLTALTNGGDWEKGLMAGLGAYGGASLSQGLSGAGMADIGKNATEAAVQQAAEQGLQGEAYNKFIQGQVENAMQAAGTGDALAAGFGAAKGAPIDFLKNNKWGLMALAAPALMGDGKEQGAGAPALDPGNIRPYDYDPRTQRYTALPMYKARYADGGDVAGNPQSAGILQAAMAPKMGGEDSKAVYEYLMGRGPNPYLWKNNANAMDGQNPADAAAQDAAAATKSTNAAMLPPLGGSGGGDREIERNPHVDAFLDAETPAERAARMENFGNVLGNIGTALSPLGTMAQAAFSRAATSDVFGPTIGRVANFFSTPKTAAEIANTPVFDAGLYGPTLGYTPEAIAAMQDQDQQYSMGTPAGTGGGTTAAMSGGFGAGYDPSASGTAAENDARSAGGDYGWATGGLTALAAGGIGHLGGYSDGGRLLKGPGDGVSDDIPATIGHSKEPARLADGEFVVPARIVSELGNGSTEAGARKLYQMMDRIQANRRKTVGKGKVAVNSKAERYLPA